MPKTSRTRKSKITHKKPIHRSFRVLMLEMLSDTNGMISSKRIITFLSFFCTFVGFFANLFFGIAVASYIFEGMLMLTGAGLGFTLAEKFSGEQQIDIPENRTDTGTTKDNTISFADDAV